MINYVDIDLLPNALPVVHEFGQWQTIRYSEAMTHLLLSRGPAIHIIDRPIGSVRVWSLK